MRRKCRREAQRNRELQDRIDRLQLSHHVHFNPAHSQVSHFRPHELSPSLAGGAHMDHQSRLMETQEIAVDLSRDGAALGAAGGDLLRMEVANEQPYHQMAAIACSP